MLHFLRPLPYPLRAPDQAPGRPFGSDLQGSLSHEFGKMGLQGGACRSTAQLRLSLLVPTLVFCSLLCEIPERVAVAILSVTGWQEENMLVHY